MEKLSSIIFNKQTRAIQSDSPCFFLSGRCSILFRSAHCSRKVAAATILFFQECNQLFFVAVMVFISQHGVDRSANFDQMRRICVSIELCDSSEDRGYIVEGDITILVYIGVLLALISNDSFAVFCTESWRENCMSILISPAIARAL